MWDWITQAFIEFGAAFSGVFLAFWLDRRIRRRRDEEIKKELKQNLRNELESCLGLLVGQGNLLPTTEWLSTVSSGDVKLLPFDERRQLSTIYFEIENQNYEAKRVRDSAVIAQTATPGRRLDGMPATLAYWNQLSMRLGKEEQVLEQKISELLEATWW